MLNKNRDNKDLLGRIKDLIESTKAKVAISVNSEVILLNWKVGEIIKNVILEEKRAEYGKFTMDDLSEKLVAEFGKGWGTKHLRHCLRAAETFSEQKIVYAARRQLSWTHIRTVAYESDDLKREFYLEMSIAEKWTTRELQSSISSMLYERTVISKQPQLLIKQELKNLSDKKELSPDLVFKDTYVLDFLGLKGAYSEKDLEDAIIINIEKFIMEMGDGFSFIERQKRILVDADDYYLDLLFYHRKLKRLIAIDLKLGKFKPEYKGQMELYLKWLQKNEMQEGEEAPLGLLLCSEGNTEHVELLMLDHKDIRVAQYLTELPSKKWFEDKLHKAIELAKYSCNEANTNKA